MKIDMNKDFETEFQSVFWNGLTLREVLTGIIAFVASMGITFGVWYFTKLPINVSVYMGIPIMGVIAGMGYIKFQGNTPWRYLQEMWYTYRVKELVYEAGEYCEGKARVFSMKSKRAERKKDKKGGRKRERI